MGLSSKLPDGDGEITLWELIESNIVDPIAWLSAPNPQLGGRAPVELVGTEEEYKIVNLFRAVEHGLY